MPKCKELDGNEKAGPDLWHRCLCVRRFEIVDSWVGSIPSLWEKGG